MFLLLTDNAVDIIVMSFGHCGKQRMAAFQADLKQCKDGVWLSVATKGHNSYKPVLATCSQSWCV